MGRAASSLPSLRRFEDGKGAMGPIAEARHVSCGALHCCWSMMQSSQSSSVSPKRAHAPVDAETHVLRLYPRAARAVNPCRAQGGKRFLGRHVSINRLTRPHRGQRKACSFCCEAASFSPVCASVLGTPRSSLALGSGVRWPGLRNPSYLTLTHLSGSTCGRKRRMHSAAVTVQPCVCPVADAFSWNVTFPAANVRRRLGLMATRNM